MPTKGDREEAVCPFCSILRRSALVRGQVFARPLPWIIVANRWLLVLGDALYSVNVYRQHLLHIRGSRHTPANWESVPDAMDAFFDCLKGEKGPRVRAVLGHFLFTFIHPLPDGDGRSGRFIMNAMLASGGIPWTVVPVDRRAEYMQALDSASSKNDIVPFTKMIADCAKHEPPPPRRSRPGETLAEIADKPSSLKP
jgi:hypothetical protein